MIRGERLSQRHDIGSSSCIQGCSFFFCHLEGLPTGWREAFSVRVSMHGSGGGAVFLTPTSESLLSAQKSLYCEMGSFSLDFQAPQDIPSTAILILLPTGPVI